MYGRRPSNWRQRSLPPGIHAYVSQGSPEKQTNRTYLSSLLLSILPSLLPSFFPSYCLFLYRKFYFKELAHKIMEAGKSQDLQGESASWRPRRANTVGPVWVWRPMKQESQQYIAAVQRLAELRSRKRQCFCLSQMQEKANALVWRLLGRKNSLLLGGRSADLYYPGLQWIGGTRPHLPVGRGILLYSAYWFKC